MPENLLDLLRSVIAPGSQHAERRLGRAFAFVTLYEHDQARHPTQAVLDRLREWSGEAGHSLEPRTVQGALEFAAETIQGIALHRQQIDQVIQERAPTWPLAHMSAIDRNVLRLGLFETLYAEDRVPLRVAINEAVELAKLFGSETSAKFVNGVLGRAVE